MGSPCSPNGQKLNLVSLVQLRFSAPALSGQNLQAKGETFFKGGGGMFGISCSAHG